MKQTRITLNFFLGICHYRDMLNTGTQAPTFSALDQNGITQTLEDFKGKWVLLYFYPKDDTSGCTKEACGLRDNYDALQKYATILGVSADSVESHKKFQEKYHLPFTLLADTKREIINTYGAGGFFKRISYLINPQGVIAKTYEKVNPTYHAREILHDLQEEKEKS